MYTAIHSPCKTCLYIHADKTEPQCFKCKDRLIYDAVLSGVSKEEFDSWFECIPKELMHYPPDEDYRCTNENCFRRVLKENQLCTRCHKFLIKGKKGKQKLETKKEVVRKEKVMETFIEFCIMKYTDLVTAAKFFGTNKYYLYSVKSYDIYPSPSMLSAMSSFIKEHS